MPPVRDIPKPLRAYETLGFSIRYQKGDRWSQMDCPFCGKEDKMGVSAEHGGFNCPAGSCQSSGSFTEFLRRYWEQCKDVKANFDQLAQNRGFLSGESLKAWGVVWSPQSEEWLIPGFDHEGKLVQLYPYKWSSKEKRFLLYPTAEHHGLFGMTVFERHKKEIWVCEGIWDAIAIWEVLTQLKTTGDGYAVTGNEAASLAADVNIVGTPSCTTFQNDWFNLVEDRKLVLLYHSDHPKANAVTGILGPAAGHDGMKLVIQKLASKAGEKPTSTHYLYWGESGYDPEKKSGYDIRDMVTEKGDTLEERAAVVDELAALIVPTPSSWVPTLRTPAFSGSALLPMETCEDWESLLKTWKRAIRWTKGIDKTLAVMLACITSTKSQGDQLWCKIMGPPGTGKTLLCEALSCNTKYTKAISKFTGFHSGYRMGKGDKEDHSLINQLRNKTLILKDGDTLLRLPNREEVLSEGRDLYDRVARTFYRGGVSNNYEGVNMTWLLCGTAALKEIDSSELGNRFLDCYLARKLSLRLERSIGLQVGHRAVEEVGFESNCHPESRDTPEMVYAKQMTSGYIQYLGDNAQKLVRMVTFEDESVVTCHNYASFAAWMRARPSEKQLEFAVREQSTRLTSQFCRLGMCLAAVFNRDLADAEILERVRHIALDTSDGVIYRIVRAIFREGGQMGLEEDSIHFHTGDDAKLVSKMLPFMVRLGAIEAHEITISNLVRTGRRTCFRLRPALYTLYRAVVLKEEIEDQEAFVAGDEEEEDYYS